MKPKRARTLKEPADNVIHENSENSFASDSPGRIKSPYAKNGGKALAENNFSTTSAKGGYSNVVSTSS